MGCGEGVSASPQGEGAGEGAAPSPEIFLILALNMVSFGAFLMVFFTVQLPVLNAKPEFNRYIGV